MNTIIVATWVSAISVAFIAIFGCISLWLAFTIRAGDKRFRRQVSDLYQAIVISNILSDLRAMEGSIHLRNKINTFQEQYKGKTPIFD